jgi:hypothetical protein
LNVDGFGRCDGDVENFKNCLRMMKERVEPVEERWRSFPFFSSSFFLSFSTCLHNSLQIDRLEEMRERSSLFFPSCAIAVENASSKQIIQQLMLIETFWKVGEIGLQHVLNTLAR